MRDAELDRLDLTKAQRRKKHRAVKLGKRDEERLDAVLAIDLFELKC